MALAVPCLLSAFPLWLDSPGRSNPNDPKNPLYQTTSQPSTTGLNVYARYRDGSALSGAWVMLNTDSAGAKQPDSNGLVHFPAATFPANVHVFAPRSAGSPIASPRIFSVYGVTSNQVTVDLFMQIPYIWPATKNIYTYLSTTAGDVLVEDLSSYGDFGGNESFNTAGLYVSHTFAWTTPGNKNYLSAIEHSGSSTGPVLSALFYPMFVGSTSDITITATTSLSGYSAPSIIYSTTNGGSSANINYQFIATPAGAPSTQGYWADEAYASSLPFTVSSTTPYPTGATNFTYVASEYPDSFTLPRHYRYDYLRSSTPLSNPVFDLPGYVDWTLFPSSSSTTWSFQMASGTQPTDCELTFGSYGDDGQSSLWYVICLNPTGIGPFSEQLPSVFPPAIPSNYIFQTGLTYTASVRTNKISGVLDQKNLRSSFANAIQEWISECQDQGTW